MYEEDKACGRSTREEVEEALDLVRASIFHDSRGAIVGDGNGVISSIAAICGEEMMEPGETEPAVECNHDLTLGIRWVKLAADALDLILGSNSLEATEEVRRRLCRSVLMCRSCNIEVGSTNGGD